MFADVFNYHIFTLVIDTSKTKNIFFLCIFTIYKRIEDKETGNLFSFDQITTKFALIFLAFSKTQWMLLDVTWQFVNLVFSIIILL